MSVVEDLVAPTGVMAALKVSSKKQLMQALSQRAAAETGLDERRIFEVVSERERIGSTGFGRGVAIPHGKIEGLEQVVGVFARLDHPVDYDALDHQPVDLVFLLLAPDGAGADHLKALARVSRMFRNDAFVEKLRGARTQDAIVALLSSTGHSKAA